MKVQTRLYQLNKMEVIKTYLRNDVPFGNSLFDVSELTDQEKEQLKAGSTLMHRPSMIDHYLGKPNAPKSKIMEDRAAAEGMKVVKAKLEKFIDPNVTNPFKNGDSVLYDGKPFKVMRAYVYKGKPYCILSDKRQVSANRLEIPKNKSKK